MKLTLMLLGLMATVAVADTYVDNGDGTVTRSNFTEKVDPKLLSTQIAKLIKSRDSYVAAVNAQIDALSAQLNVIKAQVPTAAQVDTLK